MAHKIYYYIGYRRIIITSTWSNFRVISETFGVSGVTRKYIYYFQWEFWQRTIPINEVCYLQIFKSFSPHCPLLLTMVISLNYFAIYIIQKTNPCIYSFTFYLYRFLVFVLNILYLCTVKERSSYEVFRVAFTVNCDIYFIG